MLISLSIRYGSGLIDSFLLLLLVTLKIMYVSINNGG